MKEKYRSTDLEPTLNIWDFAGQDLYYTTHQTFLSSRAIYLVVFNLSQDLDKPVPFPDNAACNDGSGGSVTYRTSPIQYLDFWMQSIYTYTKKNYSQKELKQNSPPIFIVGTHRNSVGGDDMPEDQRKTLIKKIFDRIHNEIKDKPYYRHVVSKFYSVENSLEDNRKIQELRKHIEDVAEEEPYMGEKIPLEWLTFDDKKGKISGGKPVMTLKQVMDGFGIEDEPELLTMLKFYHDLGHIIYFGGDGAKESQTLKDVVILDPHWLIKAFKKILTVEPRKEQTVKYRKSWDRLKDKGILEDFLIDHMWQDIREHKQALLDLMDKFDLLCERVDESREEEKSTPASSTATQPCPANASYYVPSMLRQQTSRSPQPQTTEMNSNVFYVDFKEFLPDGLHHRLVVRALRWSQKLGGTNPFLLYDRANFYVDDHHKFALQMVHESNLAYIKVSVMRVEVYPPPQYVNAPSADVTRKVKDFVEENLQKLKTMWIERIKYCISVQCPNENDKVTHFLPLEECLEKPEVVCRFENSQVVIKTDRFQAMFKQESSEEEASAREDIQPMSDIHFRQIAKDIGNEWKQLASYLGIRKEEVDKIEIDHRQSVNEQIFQMLVLWRQKRGNKVNEMRKELIDALIQVDRRDLADKVQNRCKVTRRYRSTQKRRCRCLVS
ncbi:uncharacterized protein LOC119731909 [Patiria miniata]|uniref:non-specific serine/threonine protein kinase n=1 Tax=Patiria miniata TaxID=46514 RepID=A0A914AB84_PATMI|nr:uncharacterized protein LOC119731909 [Patiria miniata]